MFTDTYFMKTQDLLERGLNNASFKRRILADNIANADVPHFKRSEVTFEANLKRALESEESEKKHAVPTQISHEKHIEFFKPLNYKDVQSKANVDYLTTMRADGNNVDIEKEMTEVSHNQMAYTIMVERLNQNFRLLNTVIRTV
ncbi:MAG TPA: flagellar basal body rod protein FlgB [Leptospiraceae bacterium]|nr:flagellar basal body rod protein FlgB [Leptospiraceae bacterium]HMW06734.1 flagellar basal body rod protein FlgB [Leptospiraceae bacterium]HMX33523.1 flagellar basal body rod protein FlgB [Leptospiraceae bacterium]HMY32040.1 flagellar basal body rod protein FlgB [Leptospiraceae bacterium]HMZ67296.1 flagellar basal body rod protein FlgB [Leptospiraceae bacterium]